MGRSIWWKVAAAAGLVAVLGTAGAITLLYHGRVQPLGLAQAGPRSPAASPSPDDPLTLACRRPAVPGTGTTGVAGLWETQRGSIAGYRAHERFAELTSPHEAVARTDQLSGWVLVAAGDDSIQIQTGCIAIDVRNLNSVDELPGFNTADRDQSARDMLGSRSHPFVVFEPYPSTIAVDPASAAVQHIQISGDLEISGVTKPARFALDVRLQNSQLTAAGSTTVPVGDFGVQVPEEVGGFVQVDPHITLEVSLILLHSRHPAVAANQDGSPLQPS